jgi:hypothetical protein
VAWINPAGSIGVDVDAGLLFQCAERGIKQLELGVLYDKGRALIVFV